MSQRCEARCYNALLDSPVSRTLSNAQSKSDTGFLPRFQAGVKRKQRLSLGTISTHGGQALTATSQLRYSSTISSCLRRFISLI